MLALVWDKLHLQSKEDILGRARLAQKLKHYKWVEIDGWIKRIITLSIEGRSRSIVTIGG